MALSAAMQMQAKLAANLELGKLHAKLTNCEAASRQLLLSDSGRAMSPAEIDRSLQQIQAVRLVYFIYCVVILYK